MEVGRSDIAALSMPWRVDGSWVGNAWNVGPHEKPIKDDEAVSSFKDAGGVGVDRRTEKLREDEAAEDWNKAEKAKPCERDSSHPGTASDPTAAARASM
jgi:hypothetical protein